MIKCFESKKAVRFGCITKRLPLFEGVVIIAPSFEARPRNNGESSSSNSIFFNCFSTSSEIKLGPLLSKFSSNTQISFNLSEFAVWFMAISIGSVNVLFTLICPKNVPFRPSWIILVLSQSVTYNLSFLSTDIPLGVIEVVTFCGIDV